MSEEIKQVDLEEPFKDDPEYAFFQALDDFVDRLCIAMEEQGVSQSELARRLGVSRQHISAFISDPGNPTLQTMVQMAHVLGFSLDLALTSSEGRARNRRQVHVAVRSKESNAH